MKLQIREINHVVLRVRDMERMVRFYAEVLGAERVAFRPKFNMTHLRAGSAMIDLVAGDPGGVAHLKAHDVPVGNQVELKGPSDGKPPPD